MATIESNTYVYLIQHQGAELVKIGFSINPVHRLACMQSGNPAHMVLVKTWRFTEKEARLIERVIHKVIADKMVKGEWFSITLSEAERVIKQVIRKTKGGQDRTRFNHLFIAPKDRSRISPERSKSAKIGAHISKANRDAISKRACDAIGPFWCLPNNEHATSDLLRAANKAIGKRGKLHYRTATKHLGRRPIEQANYQAAQKRKESRNAKAS